MNKEAVLHIPNLLDSYGLASDRVVLRLRTAKNDIRRVRLYYVDKYLFERTRTYHEADMNRVASCDRYDYFEVVVAFHFISMQYFFSLENTERVFYYGKDTFQSEKPSHISDMYNFPVLADSVLLDIPEWARDAVAYQIFPERFFRSSNSPADQIVCGWYDTVDYRSVLGGNIPGILEKIDYLHELGINLLYLNPIFPSRSNHKYDTRDYFDIDPDFGTQEDFHVLVQACHDRGIRVVLDGVFNHSGKDFFAFQDVVEHGEDSAYTDWFMFDSLPIDQDKKYGPELQYKSFGYYHAMPKFNHANPAVIDYICSVGRYWIEEFDIDGWRMDVADEVPFDVWRRFRREVREVKHDLLLLGEIWYDSRPWLNGDQFDSVMNYLFFDAVNDFIADRNISASDFANRLGFIRGLYKKPVFDVLWNLIDSHDTSRFLHRAGEHEYRLRLAALVQMTFPGIPCVYYGSELGMTGGPDPDCRRGMRWDRIDSHVELRSYYTRLIHARRNTPALTHGDFVAEMADDSANVFVFRRAHKSGDCLVILNNGTKTFTYRSDRALRDLLTDWPASTIHTTPAGEGSVLQYV